MAPGGGRRIRIPEGLTELLQEFTVSVLKEQPDDLVEFAADYFVKARAEKRGKVDFADGEVGNLFLSKLEIEDVLAAGHRIIIMHFCSKISDTCILRK